MNDKVPTSVWYTPSRFRCLAPTFWLVFALIWPSGSTLAADLALRVVNKSESPGKAAGSLELTYTLVNTSSKVITAWAFGCMTATQDGKSTVGFGSSDAYSQLANLDSSSGESASGESALTDGLIRPGQQVEEKVEISLDSLDGPYAAVTCGPLMVIFDDVTYEGDSKLLSSHFKTRAEDARDNYRAYIRLREELAAGWPVEEATARVVAAQKRGIDDPEGLNVPISEMTSYQGDAEALLQSLWTRYQQAYQHLPKSWQENVAKELNP